MNTDSLINFYEYLFVGDSTNIKNLFAHEPKINTPLFRPCDSFHSYERFVQESQDWLYEHNASSEWVNTIETPDSVVIELILHVSLRGEQVGLPVAIKADLDNKQLVALRVYHSTWPLNGNHQVRPPLIDAVEGLEEPPVIQRYMQGLAAGDPDLVLSLFTEDGYAREPSGDKFRYQGPEELAKFYGMLSKGPVVLHHCSVTFDGKCAAIEYICDEWAHTKLLPQAGIAVYELAGEDKLRAARIYDDVEPPFVD